MLDTMTGTKIIGGVCGTFLVFLLANWAGEGLYSVGAAEGHGEEHEQAYTIPVEGGGEEAGGGEEVDIAAVLASGDAAKGEKVFAKCKACHKIDGTNGTGPHLDGVVNRTVASVEGFAYSDPMKAHGGDWTPERLYPFIHNPKGEVPGTKMGFAGLPKPQDLADVIAYLGTLS